MSDFESNNNELPRRRQRMISSLTQQQRQHKRDLDRKAQRALRQRTKSRIQDLEADLTRLKASSSQRATIALEELRLLREENQSLKSRLADIGNFALRGGLLVDRQISHLSSDHSEGQSGELDCITGDWPNLQNQELE
jgi:phage I-like protein